MISIIKATEKDYSAISRMGRVAVEAAHRESCPPKDMQEFLDNNYTDAAIKEELNDAQNIYHIITVNGQPAGFSKIVLNAAYQNIQQQNITKLDRIYLLREFFNLKLGYQLLQFNIALAKKHNQIGIWLFAWVGNERAVNFYVKTGFKIVGSSRFKVTETHYNLQHQMLLIFT